MENTSRRAHLLWSCLQVLNRDRFDMLMNVYGSLENAAKHVDGQVLRTLGCREQTVSSVLERMSKCDAAEEERLLERAKARIIAFDEPDYPRLLGEIPDAPIFLYAQGDVSVLSQPCVALVGTRRMTPYGKRVTEEFSRALALANIVTVSGLAKGVDSLVARESIQSHGKTVAVLGQGLLTLSSESRYLADEIIAAGGAVLSEFPLRTRGDLFTFPLRNRIIAGLSLATVVLEAPESSGALITANLAFDYDREVFAVPGQMFDPNFAGCHTLIKRQKAKLSDSPRDVLQEIGVIVTEDDPEKVPYVPKSPDDEKIWKALSGMPQSMDELVEKSGLSAGAVSAILTLYELNGAAKNLGSGQWIRL